MQLIYYRWSVIKKLIYLLLTIYTEKDLCFNRAMGSRTKKTVPEDREMKIMFVEHLKFWRIIFKFLNFSEKGREMQ